MNRKYGNRQDRLNNLVKFVDNASEEKFKHARIVGRQHAIDVTLVTLHNIGFNKDDIRNFIEEYKKNEHKYCSDVVKDADSDPEIVYSKADIDRDLEIVLPEDLFVPYDERYSNVYFFT